MSMFSSGLSPSKGDIDTIEVIDEWALMYVNEDDPLPNRNTIGCAFEISPESLLKSHKTEEFKETKNNENHLSISQRYVTSIKE